MRRPSTQTTAFLKRIATEAGIVLLQETHGGTADFEGRRRQLAGFFGGCLRRHFEERRRFYFDTKGLVQARCGCRVLLYVLRPRVANIYFCRARGA